MKRILFTLAGLSLCGVLHAQEAFYTEGSSAKSGKGVVVGDAVGILADKFSVSATLGGGYDSNVFLSEVDEVESWLSWVSLGANFNSRPVGSGAFFGFDVSGSNYFYEDARADNGRDSGELAAGAFAGIRGAKTEIRLDTDFQLRNGNTIDYSNIDREILRADSDTVNVSLSGYRIFPRSKVTGFAFWRDIDFSGPSRLNDSTLIMGDVGWLYRPGFAPKTHIGLGLRGGEYDTRGNVDQTFLEPSIRLEYAASAKTSVNARFGAQFIEYDGDTAIDETSQFSGSLGVSWQAAPGTRVGVEAYRDFNPSYTSVNQSFTMTGFRLNLNQRLPYDFTGLMQVAYESADYFSTVRGASVNRDDDYVRLGLTISRQVNLVSFLDTTISGFVHWNNNDSNISSAEFDQLFTGVKLGIVY